MSKKSTKIIAAAGVVAGLGVAALPALTFAAQSVKGDVNVQAEVLSAIAMTIEGNQDGGTAPVDTYMPDGAAMIGNYDTTGKTAYSELAQNQVSSTKTTILPNALVEGTQMSDFGSLITVYTNDANGYTLSVADADTSASLKKGTEAGAPEIPVLSESNTLQAGHSAWGFKGGLISTWTAMPTSESSATIKNGSAVAAGDQTTVLYAVSTSATQPTGLYSDVITYTATTANN